MADQFHRNKQDRQPPNRTGKMLDVLPETMLANSLNVVIDKNEQGTSQSHVDVSCRRIENRNLSHQVSKDDEKSQSPDHRNISFPGWSHEIGNQLFNESIVEFKHLLHDAGIHAVPLS